MTRVDWINGGAVAGALAVSVIVAGVATGPVGSAPTNEMWGPVRWASSGAAPPAAAQATLTDADGHVVRLRPFRRIVAGSSVADRLLLELCEHDRIVGLTEHGARYSPFGNAYAGKALVTALEEIEALLALRPDLLLVNNYHDPRRIDRLREAGIEVFDLGEMRGLATLMPNIEQVGILVGHPERARTYRHTLEQRLARVAAPLAAGARRRGMYLTAYGDRLYGGTTGTNYHDVLEQGGVTDVAAARYRDWPDFATEQVLGLDPELVVTKPGMTALLCRRPGFERLRACGPGGRIVEIPNALLDDPGPTILEGAEALYDAVYGQAGRERAP